MSISIPEDKLPAELTAFAAVEAAYPQELARITDALRRGLPVLVEAEKELTLRAVTPGWERRSAARRCPRW